MDKATGLKPDQQSDKSKPTTAVVASKPLTEAQWVSAEVPKDVENWTDLFLA